MSRARLAAACVLALGLAGVGMWGSAHAPAVDPLAGRPCGDCHVSSGEVDPAHASVLVSSQEKLCEGCHPRAVKASHPSGIKPSQPLAAGFPADWKGELTCSSCHLLHGATHGALRGDKRRKAFCGACHDAGFFERMADGGDSLLASGHLDAGGGEAEPLLDPFTAQCMGCHGESGDRRVSIANGATSRHAGSGVNHPVGVRYRDAERFGGFRAQARLDAAIELPGGMVSCISCHLGYSGKHGAVVRPSRIGTGLCLECHDL